MIADPKLADLHAQLTALLETAEDWNDPRVTVESVGTTGKPESRPPGRQQAPGLMRAAHRIIAKACDEMDAAFKRASRTYDDKPDVPDVVGGHTVPEEEPMREPVYVSAQKRKQMRASLRREITGG